MTRLAILIVAVGLGACGRDPVIICDPCFSSAIAYGSVVTADGAPLATGTPIGVWAFEDTCDGLLIGGADSFVRAGGEFRMRMSTLRSGEPARCFRFTVNPQLRPGIRTDTVEITALVEFREEVTGEPLDSVRLDVVLPRVE